MREILFKAKHVHAFNGNSYLDGQWVEGFLSAENYINDGVSDVLIDPSTICQCTGLTDKNGNKIWENDIVHLFGIDTIRNYDWKAVVEFGNPNGLYSWGYQLKPIGHFEYNEDILCWVDMEEANIYCEVIGNVFDGGY